jgi:predicted dehydrogenase
MSLLIGLIGKGAISQFYITALEGSKNFELAAICDRCEDKLEPCRDRIDTFTSHQDLLTQAEVDAVIVTVPNDQHFQICKDALLAGKHVCCEKPLTIRMEEADELVALSRKTGRTLFTAFHRRYNHNFRTALEHMPDLSCIEKVTARYLENIEEHVDEDAWYLQPDRCGGGCITDIGPNAYDMLATVMGRMHVVSATVDGEHRGIERRATIGLQSESGIPADVHLDWAFAGEKKDVIFDLKDGRQIRADMLAGYEGFKSSLFHEYEAVLADFEREIAEGKCHGERGCDVVRLVQETYKLANRDDP